MPGLMGIQSCCRYVRPKPPRSPRSPSIGSLPPTPPSPACHLQSVARRSHRTHRFEEFAEQPMIPLWFSLTAAVKFGSHTSVLTAGSRVAAGLNALNGGLRKWRTSCTLRTSTRWWSPMICHHSIGVPRDWWVPITTVASAPQANPNPLCSSLPGGQAVLAGMHRHHRFAH